MRPAGLATDSWRHIAVAVDSSAESARAFDEAVAAARRHHTRLTIICVAPRPWPYVGMAGVSPISLENDMLRLAADVTRRLAALVPPDLPCTTYARCGRTVGEILGVLRSEQADVLFIAAPHGVQTGLCGQWALRRLARRTPAAVVEVAAHQISPSCD
jgi:nucleotide-binding universal stress UspA family protein